MEKQKQIVSFLTIIALIIICLIQIDTNKTLRATNNILKQTDDILKTKNNKIDITTPANIVLLDTITGRISKYNP